MKVNYDKEADVLYIRFKEGEIEESDEQQPGVIFDYDKSGNVLGIEILAASQKVESPSQVEMAPNLAA